LIPLLFLTKIPPQTAYRIAQIVLLICFIISLALLTQIFSSKNLKFLFLISFSFAPLYTSITQTQSSPITLFLFVLILGCLQQQRWLQAGLISGLLTYKPQLAILLYLYLFSLKNKQLTLGLIFSFSLCLLVSYALAGQQLLTLPTFISAQITQSTTAPLQRISLTSIDTQIQYFIPIYRYN